MIVKKRKVFFILNTNVFSGAEAVNLEIIENLKEKYDFYWVSRKGPINEFLDERNIKWIEINNLNIKEIKRIIRDYKPDILHATDYKASVICSLVKGKTYLIEHLHNNSPWLNKICPNSIAFLFAGLKADKILTVSESIEKEYIFSKIIRKKIMNISNPVSRENILNKIDENYQKKYDICCVARLTKQKNPIKFLEIVKEIKNDKPNLKVIWVGTGEMEKEVLDKTKELDLNNTITFVGFKKNPYIYMAQSKLFVLASDWEGYGLVAFEALALGLPAIVSNVGGLVNIVDSSCGRLCKNTTDFVSEIRFLIKDNNKYKEKSENAKKKSIILENIDKYINIIDSLYNF